MPKLTRGGDRSIEIALGRRMRLRRQMLKFSQTVVAKQLGVSFQQLQKYENGTDRISAGRLFEVASILRAPFDYFFEDLIKAPSTELEANEKFDLREHDFELTRRGMKLLRAFAKIRDDKTQKYIADLVDQLASLIP